MSISKINTNSIAAGASPTMTDLTLSGSLFLGGTGSANELDDYEEGTFSPLIGGSTTNGTYTYGRNLGNYIKVGNVIHFRIDVNLNGITIAATGQLKVRGLPFTASDQNGFTLPVYFNYMDNGNRVTVGEVEGNNSRCSLRYNLDNAIAGHYDPSELNSNTNIRFGGHYFID